MVAQCCQEWWLSVAPGTESVPRTLNAARASTSLSPPIHDPTDPTWSTHYRGQLLSDPVWGGHILVLIKVHTVLAYCACNFRQRVHSVVWRPY